MTEFEEQRLEKKLERMALILKTRNQIIDAQRKIIERQEESFRELMQMLDPHLDPHPYQPGGCSLEYDVHKERFIQRDSGDETWYQHVAAADHVRAGD